MKFSIISDKKEKEKVLRQNQELEKNGENSEKMGNR